MHPAWPGQQRSVSLGRAAVGAWPGYPFQARDRWATSGPHLGHAQPDCSGQHRSPPVRHRRSSPGRLNQGPQVVPDPAGSLRRKRTVAKARIGLERGNARIPEPAGRGQRGGFSADGDGKEPCVRLPIASLSTSIVVLSERQRKRRTSIDLEELEIAYAQASATLEAAKDASAQARSVRRGVSAVLTRVGESLKRRRTPPASA
jgi:hypothetical protein